MKLFSLLATVRNEIPRVVPLMRDARVPVAAKIAAVLAAVLVVSPLDLFGDIPFLGFFDDAALLAFIVHVFVTYGLRRTAPETSDMIVVN